METGIAPTMLKDPLDDWVYYYDTDRHIVYLKAYKGNDDELVIYDRYYIDGCLYKTALSSNNLRPQEINDPDTIYMFKNARCRKIIIGDKVDISKCVIMKDMFRNCINLEEINFGRGFDTRNVADMRNMFRGCSKLRKLDLSSFNTGYCLDMSCMFLGCESLTDVWVTNFNTANVGDFSWMFCNCKSLRNLNLSSFTINIERVFSMFDKCTSLETVYFKRDEFDKIASLPTHLTEIHPTWYHNDGIITDVHFK